MQRHAVRKSVQKAAVAQNAVGDFVAIAQFAVGQFVDIKFWEPPNLTQFSDDSPVLEGAYRTKQCSMGKAREDVFREPGSVAPGKVNVKVGGALRYRLMNRSK